MAPQRAGGSCCRGVPGEKGIGERCLLLYALPRPSKQHRKEGSSMTHSSHSQGTAGHGTRPSSLICYPERHRKEGGSAPGSSLQRETQMWSSASFLHLPSGLLSCWWQGGRGAPGSLPRRLPRSPIWMHRPCKWKATVRNV